MDTDQMLRKVDGAIGTLQNQVLNNLDEVVGLKVKGNKTEEEILDRMVKKPIMQTVGTLRSLRVAIQNPGLPMKG